MTKMKNITINVTFNIPQVLTAVSVHSDTDLCVIPNLRLIPCMVTELLAADYLKESTWSKFPNQGPPVPLQSVILSPFSWIIVDNLNNRLHLNFNQLGIHTSVWMEKHKHSFGATFNTAFMIFNESTYSFPHTNP